MSNIKRVLEYMDEGMSEQEAYQAVSIDMELSKSLHLRIKSMVEESYGFIEIKEIVRIFNSYEHKNFKMTEKKIILEVLKYPNYFHYINGFIIDVEEETYYKIIKYHDYIKNLLSPYFNPSDIQYIVTFLLFLKRADDINLFGFEDDKLLNFIFFKDNLENLIQQLDKLRTIVNMPFNILDDFINYAQKLDENVSSEIINIMLQIDTRDYSNTTLFGSIFELLIDRNLEHNYTNKSMQKLMIQLSNMNGSNKILNPFGSLGGLIIETLQHNRNQMMPYNYTKYQDINKRTTQLAFMIICMYGNTKVEFESINSLDNYSNNEKYDLVITELPLARKFTQSELNSISVRKIKYNNLIGEIKSKDSILYYIVYILSKINQNGKGVFNVPSGFLFSSNFSYKRLRKFLIEKDLIESIINLPAGTMYHSGINTAILIINKNKNDSQRNKIKVINGSLLYEAKLKNKGLLNENILDIESILKAYYEETKDSVIINIEDISKQDYSLDANRFKREVLELQNSLKDGESKYLKDLAILRKGKNIDKKRVSTIAKTPIIKIQNLYNDIVDMYLKNGDNLEMIDEDKSYIINEECVLVASVGEQLKPTIFKPNNSLSQIFITTNLCALIPKRNITVEYLYYQMYSKVISEQIKNLTSGSIRTFLTIKNLGKIIVPYIELNKQQIFINTQKASIMAEQRAELEAKLKLMGYKEEMKSKESDIVRTLTHQLRPSLSNLSFKIQDLKDIIESNHIGHLIDNDILIPNDPDAKKIEINTLEEITNAIDEYSSKLHDSLNSVDEIMKFKLEAKDFINNDIYAFFKDYINKQNKGYEINLKGKSVLVDFNKKSLIELLDQLLRNAEQHAFKDNEKYKIDFYIKEDRDKQDIVIIEYFNNGEKFNVTKEMYTNAFRKHNDSSGSGIGGNFIYRVIKAHNGELYIQGSNEGFKFYIELPKKQSWEDE